MMPVPPGPPRSGVVTACAFKTFGLQQILTEGLLNARTVLGPGDTVGNPNKIRAWEAGVWAVSKYLMCLEVLSALRKNTAGSGEGAGCLSHHEWLAPRGLSAYEFPGRKLLFISPASDITETPSSPSVLAMNALFSG